MTDLKTTQEISRTPDGSEYVRLATAGANWKATLTEIFNALGGGASSDLTVGTTAILSGTTKHVVYDLSGIFQEAANFTIESGNPNVTAGNAYLYDGSQVIIAQTAQMNFYEGGAGNLTGTGTSNLGTGSTALSSVTTGSGNCAVGSAALFALTDGTSNLAIGANALDASTSAINCVAIGAATLGGTGAPANCVAIGTSALHVNTASGNLGIGAQALEKNTIGANNTAIGGLTLNGNVSGSSCVALGDSALTISNADQNVAVGNHALIGNTSAANQVAIGMQALPNCIDGGQNTACGYIAGYGVIHGVQNVCIGFGALGVGAGGTDNSRAIAIGYSALYVSSSTDNIGIGCLSGHGISSGVGNICIGSNVTSYNQGTTGSHNIIIGYDLAAISDTANDQLNIGSYIFGTGLNGTGTTISSGKIGIGIKAPANELDVAGAVSLTTFIEGTEMSAPAAPAANGFRIFAQDNGAGKTQLMVIFNTGAAQQIAIQP